jgi:hypothetical protein
MVLILYGNMVYLIHKIKYREKNHRLKIHYRKTNSCVRLIHNLIYLSRVKADFIRTKYQQMAYINRLKDETNGTFEDLHLV